MAENTTAQGTSSSHPDNKHQLIPSHEDPPSPAKSMAATSNVSANKAQISGEEVFKFEAEREKERGERERERERERETRVRGKKNRRESNGWAVDRDVSGPETEFLVAKKETGNEWELFKENVRPLKRSRKVGLLNGALKSHSDYQLRNSLLQHRRRLIEAINEYTGEDPLQPWIEKAQPVEKLTIAYKKFLTRSMGQLKATDEDGTENHLPARSFGTVLTRQISGNKASECSDIFRKKLKPDRTPGTALSIFKDKGSSSLASHEHLDISKAELKPWHSLGARAERNKENNEIPSKWTSTKIPKRPGQSIRRPPPGPCIEIFVDEEASEQHKRANEKDQSSTLQLRPGDCRDIKKETELLRENPLRNFPPSSLPR
ncbi:S-adenosylmethionine:tRNAribosyltransferase-isomerase [Striga asiatica]|uniref:S-adenosylmethionine:tRNAribosyltransferase-isomerase n=1 Tax=Striga asiatica TaxID=4170 RepID=A0A5A7PVT1_STRAF|nr:S-adenosylmethionine:tRNAribosyltransferase-isomerase [Striga asiatica]